MSLVLEHKAKHNYKSYIHISFQLPCCILPLLSLSQATLPQLASSPLWPYTLTQFLTWHPLLLHRGWWDQWVLGPARRDLPCRCQWHSEGVPVPGRCGRTSQQYRLDVRKSEHGCRKDNLTSTQTFWFSLEGLSYQSLLPCPLMATSTKMVVWMAL